MTGAVRRTLVVPMYREAARIESTVAALAASALNGDGTEFVFVDDGSDDGSGELARAAAERHRLARVRVTRNPVNRGKGGAVRRGVLAARGAVVAFADADLAAGVEEIERCFAAVESDGAQVALSTRLHADSVITRLPPLSRRLAGKAFNVLLRATGLTAFRDTQCGLKVFTRDAARRIFDDLRIEGFAFDVEVLVRAQRAGFTVVEVPISWHHVDESHVDTWRHGLRMVVDVLRLRRALGRPAPATMRRETFEVMHRVEADHWWWRAKRALVAREIERSDVGFGRAVDVGCGTGESLAMLSGLGFKPAVGTDASADALDFARSRTDPAIHLVASEAGRLPLAAGSIACLTSLDVVEHLDDDGAALAEYRRVVRPGGVVVLTVPAYPWAWSDHDVALGHRRRYTTASLEAAVRAAGLEVEHCTYFHSWLVVPAFLLRRTPLRLLVRGSAEEASYGSPRVNRWLARVAAAEARVSRRRRLPFGLSILLRARVPGPR